MTAMVTGVCPMHHCEKSSTSSRAETPEWDSAEFRQTDQINGLRSLFGDVIRTRSVIKGLPVFIIDDPLRDLLPIKWQQIRSIWRPSMIRWLLAIAVLLAEFQMRIWLCLPTDRRITESSIWACSICILKEIRISFRILATNQSGYLNCYRDLNLDLAFNWSQVILVVEFDLRAYLARCFANKNELHRIRLLCRSNMAQS
jgi:hypothetical protein